MSGLLSREANYVQNPALGSMLIWRFTVGFTQSHGNSDSPSLPLCFLVLPIVLHRETFEQLRSTQKQTGLHAFADKFSKASVGRTDLLFAIHRRTEEMKSLTINSIQAGVRHSLFTIVPSEAKIIPLSLTKPSGIASSIKPLIDGAEKLGLWFAQLTPFEIATTLKVSL